MSFHLFLSVKSSLTFPRSSLCVPTAAFTYKPLSWIILFFAIYLCPFLSFLVEGELFKRRPSCLFMYFHHRAWQLIISANIFQAPAFYQTKQISSVIPTKNSIREVFLTIPWGRASLVAQWLRIHLPLQGTWVRTLVREDPTCSRATKPVRHNYWARVPQLLKPARLEPVFRNKRSHLNEKPMHRNEE